MKSMIYALALLVLPLAACTDDQPQTPANAEVQPAQQAAVQEPPTQTAVQTSPQAGFIEGRHYERIESPQPIDADDAKVDVIEIFWYGCPHCYDFEPYISEWRQNMPESAEFTLLPATLNPSWGLHARAFFALQELGQVENLHGKIFQAIHAQGRNLGDLDSITRFVGRFGVDEQAFRDAFMSAEVDDAMMRAGELARAWRITGVPSVIVNGEYRVSAGMAGGYDRMIDVIDFLVEQESGG